MVFLLWLEVYLKKLENLCSKHDKELETGQAEPMDITPLEVDEFMEVTVSCRKSTKERKLDRLLERLAARCAGPYPGRMCRHITSEQQREGWRAVAELLRTFGRKSAGVLAALWTRLHPGRARDKSASGAMS